MRLLLTRYEADRAISLFLVSERTETIEAVYRLVEHPIDRKPRHEDGGHLITSRTREPHGKTCAGAVIACLGEEYIGMILARLRPPKPKGGKKKKSTEKHV